MSNQRKTSGATPIWQTAASTFENRSEYVLADLLAFDGAEFIDVAYQALLRRHADPVGSDGYLIALRSGAASKVEILGQIRFSEEGRKAGVHVDGLLLPYKLHQWRHKRVIGPVLAFVMGVARLPRLAFRLQSMEAKAAQGNQQLGTALDRLAAEVHEHLIGLENTVPETTAGAFSAFEHSLETRLTGAANIGRATVAESSSGSKASDGERHCKPGVDPVAFRDALLGAMASTATPSSVVFDEDDTASTVGERAALTVARAIDSRALDLDVRLSAVKEDARSQLEQIRAELLDRLGGLAEQTALTRLTEAVEEVRKCVLEIGSLQTGLRAVQAQATELANMVGSHVSETQNHVQAIKEVLWVKADQAQLMSLSADMEELKLSLKGHSKITDRSSEALERNVHAFRGELVHLQQRIEHIASGLPLRGEQEQIAAHDAQGDVDPHALDSFYVALEDRFRGSNELIAKRSEVYVSVIQAAIERTQGGAVLDIGCGRGEWLRTLRSLDFEARGIDLNGAMVRECREAGLDVQEAEAIAYMRGLADASIAAITGMHIIEHIPFPSLVVLFDESVRVLKPGGVVVFETPNPENIDVGSCSFYMDPTHLHPLPPPLVEFTARARGFDHVEIRRLSEHRPVPVPPEFRQSHQPESKAVKWLLDRSRERLSVAPDYAIIACKGLSQAGHQVSPPVG